MGRPTHLQPLLPLSRPSGHSERRPSWGACRSPNSPGCGAAPLRPSKSALPGGPRSSGGRPAHCSTIALPHHEPAPLLSHSDAPRGISNAPPPTHPDSCNSHLLLTSPLGKELSECRLAALLIIQIKQGGHTPFTPGTGGHPSPSTKLEAQPVP